jgi:hypothetical protein
MCKAIDFPIRADSCDLQFLFYYTEEIQNIQKLMYPQTPVKYLPISPGGELTALNLTLSALSHISDLIPDEICDHLSIENEQFRLIFYRK